MAKRKDNPTPPATVDRFDQIKKLVVIAMFSDDTLLEQLVLKGGNAIDLVHKLTTRASIDVDFSIEHDIPGGVENLRNRVERVLLRTFSAQGYHVFDVKIDDEPQKLSPELASFWGGYVIHFKVIEQQQFDKFSEDLEELRRNALILGHKATFRVDLSRHEYTTGKEAKEIDGYQIFVYSPEMMVCEKLRAICQQMPEYGPVVNRSRPGGPRARDFIDIYTLVSARNIDITAEKNRITLAAIFSAKRVPLTLLRQIESSREFHRSDFLAVQATVRPGVKVEDFDFYFDFVLRLVKQLEPFGNI